MAGLRFRILFDGFIPEDSNGTLVAGVKIPTAIANKIPAIRTEVRDIKAFVGNMQRTFGGENLTLSATYHKCYHDEMPSRPCEPSQDI